MATIKTGWLLNNNGEKFAPKTLISQVSANDGTLLEIKLENDLSDFETQINKTIDTKITTEKSERETEIAVERARIDAFVALPEGSTTGDAALEDIKIKVDGTTADSAGNAVREQINTLDDKIDEEVGKLSSEIVEMKNGFANIISFSGNAGDHNYGLLKSNFSSGTTLKFYLCGAKCNIVGWTSDSEAVILVQSALDNNFYEVKLTKDIVSIGMFLIGSGTATVYLMGEYLEYFHEENKELEALANSKVVGSNILTESLTERTNGYLYMYRDNKIGKYAYANGACARCNVKGCDKAIITGKGWDSSYGYFLYAFLDDNNNVLSVFTKDNASVFEMEVEIPEEASVIVVNGGATGKYIATIKIMGVSTSFEENYNYYSSQKESKKLITLGDSITMLGTGDRGWVGYFIEKTGCELVANVAMNSAVLSDYENTVYDGNPQQSNQTNNTLGNQVQKIINNAYEAPDIIMIAIGTNGGINITLEQIKSAYYDENNALIPLENVDRKTNAGAYRYATEKLHELYPNAIIFWCNPIMACQTIRSAEDILKFAESLRIATEYSGQIMIDTIRCGINGVNEVSGANGEYLFDGLHPNVNGAKKIGYYNASKVKPFLS